MVGLVVQCHDGFWYYVKLWRITSLSNAESTIKIQNVTKVRYNRYKVILEQLCVFFYPCKNRGHQSIHYRDVQICEHDSHLYGSYALGGIGCR